MTSTLAIDPKLPGDEFLANGEFPLTRRDLADIAAMIRKLRL